MPVPPRSRGVSAARSERSLATRRLLVPVLEFIHTESLSAIALFIATVTALIWVNSPWSASYYDLWETIIQIDLGFVSFNYDLLHWVNDGLMALFFFVVGLEIKREATHGELADARKARLPIIAALGGMAMPAAIYLLFNISGEGTKGWGIPMATDIAFALGVLALVGHRVPAELRVFLLTLAIADDVGAILVIAVFYTSHISLAALGVAGVLLLVTLLTRRLGVVEISVYLLLGVCLWAAMLKSGVHATLAGVMLGLLTPANAQLSKEAFLRRLSRLSESFANALQRGEGSHAEAALGEMEDLVQATEAPVERLERILHPFTSFLVIPIFALGNAGLELDGEIIRESATSPITLGIAVGLVAGKFTGILGATWLSVKLGMARLPGSVRWPQVAGVAMLGGIGFTVSLFITGLAFEEPNLLDDAKLGILGGSIVSGVMGYLMLRVSSSN